MVKSHLRDIDNENVRFIGDCTLAHYTEFVLFKRLFFVLSLVAIMISTLIGVEPIKADSFEYVSPVYNFPDTNGGKFVFGTYAPAWNGYHLAIDMRRPADTPVCSVLDGRVVSCGYFYGFGDRNGPGGAAIIEHKNNYGETFYALYGHLKDLEIVQGQTVTKGQTIAKVMNLINDYGVANPHLHFGINTIRASYAGYTSEGNSVGFVDPYLYLEHSCKDPVTPHTYHINGQTCNICGAANPLYDQSKPIGIEINGYQISAASGGVRTVYSVDSTINDKEVVASGIIYSLTDYSTEEDMYIGSTHKYVRNYESTSGGKFNNTVSESEMASSYAMTMKFGPRTDLEFVAKWRVKAYAKLSDGSYVYTDSIEYTIFDIAERLYQGSLMRTQAAHEYLYDNILNIVNKEYIKVEYDFTRTVK